MSILDDNILEETSIIENILKDFPDLYNIKCEADRSYIPIKLKNYLEWHSKWFKNILSYEMDTIRFEWLETNSSDLVIKFMNSKNNNFSLIRIINDNTSDENLQLVIELLNEMKEHVINIPKLLKFILHIDNIWVTEEQVRKIIDSF